jgi:hypothetical protein
LYKHGFQVEEDEMHSILSMNGENKMAWSIGGRKPEGKRLLGRVRRRWIENIEEIK